MIEVKHLSAGYQNRQVLRDVTLQFRPGEVTALIGPNGCGKSTLLKTVLRLRRKDSGEILYDGTPVEALTLRQIARQAAYLAQSRNTPSITARRMVLHGRFAHLAYPRRYQKRDYELADQALAWAGAAELAEQFMPQLSGGQRQKVYFAMALAQDTQTVFLDEPTTFLDIQHQLGVMQVARRLAGQGKAVVMVLHDLALAMRSADQIAVLYDGCIQNQGRPDEVFRTGVLDRVFGITVKSADTPDGPQYYCVE